MAETRTRDDAKVVVSAGFFNRRVQILKHITSSDDGQGGQTYNYQAPVSVWAHVDTGKPGRQAGDSMFAAQVYPTTHASISVRYATGQGITPRTKVLYNSRTYWVESVKDIQEANVIIEMYCVEYQSAGVP